MNKQAILKYGYIYFFVLSSIILLIYSLQFIKNDLLIHIVFMILFTVICDSKPIATFKSGEVTEIIVTFTAHFIALTILGTEMAIFIAVISAVIVDVIILRKPLYKGLFNAGQYGIIVLLSGIIFKALKLSSDEVMFDFINDMPALVVAIVAYYVINTAIISGVISVTTKEVFTSLFVDNFKTDVLYYATLTPITVAMILLYNPKIPVMPFLMLPPLFIADSSLNRYYRLKTETHETFKMLADIIDKRDEYTYQHSARVSEYSSKLAKKLGMKASFIRGIESAGSVHDLGKIAIEDKILNKHGKLTDEEYAKIKSHPETGYQLIKNIKPYEEIAEYILYHHERLDGQGYPKGVSGAKIPLGAKILAIADSYDAMTSDRPYRKAMTQAKAVKELRSCSGTQFDAELVEAFIEILKEYYGYVEEQ